MEAYKKRWPSKISTCKITNICKGKNNRLMFLLLSSLDIKRNECVQCVHLMSFKLSHAGIKIDDLINCANFHTSKFLCSTPPYSYLCILKG